MSHASLLFLEALNLYDWFFWGLVCTEECPQGNLSLAYLNNFPQSLSCIDWN